MSKETELLPCPFCGCALEAYWRRANPKAMCRTEGCVGAKLPVLNLDLPEDIAAWNTRKAPQPHQIAEPASQAARDVLAERARQINQEGWTPELDAEHIDGQLAGAASCYAQHVNARSWAVLDLDNGPEIYRTEPAPDNWPWDESWWKPTTPRRDAVKACALLLAEIERIDRAATTKETS